ncbi:MAG TPA: YggS family pyridoxal phosphate-dependent enzyme [Polyangiaceae bacterium]|nr:YggS family pyridoxal phosphate-dependent enzyme [Polyangiaceae bacterium]
MSVAARLVEVHSAIARAARAAGRDPASVKLVAVSKTKPVEAVRAAYAAGQRAFGENYAQELAAKAEALADLQGIEWHFIGHLQSNKAKIAAKHAHVVHTVDSTALARELGKRAAKERTSPMPVLIEVNVGGEPQKSGAAPSEIAEVVRAIQDDPALHLSGLMTVPPAGDLAVAKKTFETLALLRNLHGGAAVLPELSMGMTADLDVAIACGATIVRVGTAVFGERERAPAVAR